MANKRKLKRTINYVCGDLFAECVATSLYSGKQEAENVNALLAAVLTMHSDFVCRVSHPEPGMTAKVYYKKLIADFRKHVKNLQTKWPISADQLQTPLKTRSSQQRKTRS